MTPRMLERALTSAMADDVGPPPTALLSAILERTERTKPLPTLVALVVEPPMVMPSQVVVGVRRSRLVLVAAMLLLVLGALVVGASLRPMPPLDAWTTRGGSSARTAVTDDGPAGIPRTKWTFEAGAPVEVTPVIGGDVVLVTSADGLLHALEPASGTRRWAVDLGDRAGPPAIDGVRSRALVVDDAGTVHALGLDSGSAAWTAGIDADMTVDLALDGELVIAATTDGSIAALDAETGSLRWRINVPSAAAPTGIAVGSERVVVASEDGRLLAVRREDGAEAWSIQTAAVPPGIPTIANGVVWSGPGDDVKSGALGAYELATGIRRWQLEEPLYAPAVDGDVAVSASAVGIVSSYEAGTGTERWRFTRGEWFRTVVIVNGQAVALSDTNRQVYGLDLDTGALRWQLPLSTRPGCCLALAHGLMVVGTVSGTVTALESGPVSTAAAGTSTSGVPSPPATTTSAAPSPEQPTSQASFPLSVVARFQADALELSRPNSIAAGASGEVYVTDALDRVTAFIADGTIVRRWGSTGDGPGEFDFGAAANDGLGRSSVAVGPDGQVYVSDVQNHRVQVFTQDGAFVRAFGSLGAEAGQFTIPFDLSVDGAGDVYVIDDGAERITKFDAAGSPVWTADQSTDPRLFGHAHTAAFDSAGRLVVAIDDTAIIARLDPDTGQVIDTLPGGGCESAVDDWDRIYLVDCVTGAVRVLDERGQPVAVDPTLQLVMLRRGGPGQMVAITSNGELLILRVTPP